MRARLIIWREAALLLAVIAGAMIVAPVGWLAMRLRLIGDDLPPDMEA